MRVLVAIAAIAVGGLLAAPCATARELPPEVRAMAERAFLEGRLEDVEAILAGARTEPDRYPLLLSERWWRRADGAVLDAPEVDPWARHEARWPLVGALRRDRSRRETLGAAGLPDESPLMAYRRTLDEQADEEAIWYLEDLFGLMRETYSEPRALPASELRTFEQRRGTAQLVALASLGAFVVLCFFAALLVARGGREPPGR